MKGILGATLRHNVFVNILTIIVLVAGFLGMMSMTREIFPEMSVDMVLVSVIYRGADPGEVEEGVSRKIEEAVEGLEGIKNFYTYADENVGAAVIECLEGYDVDELKEHVRERIDAIVDFPADIETPTVMEITTRQQSLSLSVYGDKGEAELKELAEKLKREILLLPEISQVSVGGVRDYEMSIEVSEEKLRQFGLTFAAVTRAIQAQSLNMPGGTVKTSREEITVRSMGRRYSADEFGRIVTIAAPDGTLLPLERIAQVRDGFEEEPILGTFNGKRSALIRVFKTSDEDAIAISRAVDKYLASRPMPQGITVEKWSDTSLLVQERIDLLVRNGLVGFVLVFCILWLFLDLRLGFWVSLGIPLSLGGGMVVMAATGQSLNMLSLFALIMVLGIVVDDAIVVGEAIYYHRRQGLGPMAAAYQGVKEMALPVVAAVTTTIVAFCPLFFVSGVMGKFIMVVPIAVVAALSASLIECLFLLPAHLNHLPAPKEGGGVASVPVLGIPIRMRRRFSLALETFAEKVYGALVSFFLRWRYPFVAGAVATMLLALGLVAGGHLKFTFFPKFDTDYITAKVEFPRGTPLEVSHKAVKTFEATLEEADGRFRDREGKSLVSLTYAMVGAHSGYDNPRGSHLAELRAEIIPSAERKTTAGEFIAAWRETVGEIPGAISASIGSFAPLHMGKPIEIWILGEDMAVMRVASKRLLDRLGDMAGVYNTEEDYRPGKREVRIHLKPEAQTLGLTFLNVASQVRSAFYGSEALRVQRGRDNLRVYVRYPLEGRSALSQLQSMRVATPDGRRVPLSAVADFAYEEGYARIVRQNGYRRLVVTADVDDEKANASQILGELSKEFLPDLEKNHPGVKVTVEGQEQERQESMKSLGVGFALAGMGIFLILATIFRSYIQPLVIITTVPFGFAGVVFGHLALGFDLTMMSLFGLVALSGVVVNDAIIMIEAINGRLAEGMTFAEAIRSGGVRRFRPVLLTTLTTFFGLLPLIAEKSFQARVLIPMAIAIAVGVAFATLLTLFLVPCILGILNDLRRMNRWTLEGRYPDAAEVEPARCRAVEEDLEQAPAVAAAAAAEDEAVNQETSS